MSYDFDALFDGQDDDTVPIKDTTFLKILHLNENKTRHLMRLILRNELRREVLCLSGASSDQLAVVPTRFIPDEDHDEERHDAVDFFEDAGVFVTNLFVLQSGDREVPFINRFGEDDSYLDEGDPNWVLQDKEYLEYLANGSTATTYVLSLDPKGSRDKQVKAIQKWLKIWKRAYPSQKRAGGTRSVKARLIDLACWRLWRKSRWCKSDENALAKEVGNEINKILPHAEYLSRLGGKQEIKRRCRIIWPMISARLELNLRQYSE